MKDKNNIGKIMYIFLSIIAFVSVTYLFWAQSVNLNGMYASDLKTHIDRAITNGGTGYSLESKLVVLMDRITGGGTIGFCIILALIVLLTPLAVGLFFNTLDTMDEEPLGKVRNCYVGLISVFVAPLAIPFIWLYFYCNAMNINAWHNSTSMEMRLFAVLAFALYVYIQYGISVRGCIRPLSWLALSCSLLVSTWYKPSFFVGFAPVMLIWIFIDLFRAKLSPSIVKNQFLLGCAAIPAGIMVILQYWKLYGSREDVYLSLNSEADNVVYAIRVGMFLIIPLAILVYNHKKVIRDYKNGNRACVQIWILWAIELLYHQLFSEVGRSGGNFGWGVRIGNYFVYIMSMRLFWSNVLQYKRRKENVDIVSWYERAYIIAIGIIFLWEICCGIFYFCWILTGNTYYM